jgi:hypothetical protein
MCGPKFRDGGHLLLNTLADTPHGVYETATATTDLIETLRYTYAETDRVLYLFNQETNLFNRLKKKMADLGGRGQFLMPILVKNAGTWKGIAQGGTLPSALQPDSAGSVLRAPGIRRHLRHLLEAHSGRAQLEVCLRERHQADGSERVAPDLPADQRGSARRWPRPALEPRRGRQHRPALLPLPAALRSRHEVVDLMDDTDDDTILTSGTRRDDHRDRSDCAHGHDRRQQRGHGGERLPDRSPAPATSVTTTSKHLNGMLGYISNANPTTSAVVGSVGGINRSTAGNEFWQSRSCRTAA